MIVITVSDLGNSGGLYPDVIGPFTSERTANNFLERNGWFWQDEMLVRVVDTTLVRDYQQEIDLFEREMLEEIEAKQNDE